MGFLDLFIVAVMTVLKVIFITGIGLFLAMDRINLLGPEARHHLNNVSKFFPPPEKPFISVATGQPVNNMLYYHVGLILSSLGFSSP